MPVCADVRFAVAPAVPACACPQFGQKAELSATITPHFVQCAILLFPLARVKPIFPQNRALLSNGYVKHRTDSNLTRSAKPSKSARPSQAGLAGNRHRGREGYAFRPHPEVHDDQLFAGKGGLRVGVVRDHSLHGRTAGAAGSTLTASTARGVAAAEQSGGNAI